MADPEVVKRIMKELAAKPRCPDARSTQAVDDNRDELYDGDTCNLVSKPCLLDEDKECPIYEDWLAEQAQEAELTCQDNDWYMKQDEG